MSDDRDQDPTAAPGAEPRRRPIRIERTPYSEAGPAPRAVQPQLLATKQVRAWTFQYTLW
jgi:hypothetical protein